MAVDILHVIANKWLNKSTKAGHLRIRLREMAASIYFKLGSPIGGIRVGACIPEVYVMPGMSTLTGRRDKSLRS